MIKTILAYLAFTAIGVTMVTTGVIIERNNDAPATADPPTVQELRTFTGTVTQAPHFYGGDTDNEIVVKVDGLQYALADVAPRVYHQCGRYYDGNQEITRRRAHGLLPVGTQVQGYITNPFTGKQRVESALRAFRAQEAFPMIYAYLHVGNAPSVSMQMVKTGWSRSTTHGLDLKDKTVATEHAAVLASTPAGDSTAAIFCADAQEQKEEDDERHRRERRAAAAAAAALAAQDDDWDDSDSEYYYEDDDSTSSGGSYDGGYTGPRCYAPGGQTWTPC